MKQAFAWCLAAARLLAIVAWGTGTALAAALADPGLPYAQDLQQDAKAAQDKNGVVLVAFSASYCSYCKIVLNDFLIPMSRNADYQSKLVMRVVETNSALELKDFQGNRVSHRKFARDRGARFMPTVMVFDAQGRVLSKPLVGLTTVDYYGHYLDQAINEGLEKVRKPT